MQHKQRRLWALWRTLSWLICHICRKKRYVTHNYRWRRYRGKNNKQMSSMGVSPPPPHLRPNTLINSDLGNGRNQMIQYFWQKSGNAPYSWTICDMRIQQKEPLILLAGLVDAQCTGPMREKMCSSWTVWSKRDENHDENVVSVEIPNLRPRNLRLWMAAVNALLSSPPT